jgi:alpha-L-fucosidase
VDIGHAPSESYAPTGLDVAGWIRTAKQAGMDCAVLTVKHEAGFCLWDADNYDYDVAGSPAKTDVVAQFMAACKAEGIKAGIHYSIPDAHNEGRVMFKGPVSAEYFEFIKKQTKELHTKYPEIKVQVFDIASRLSKSQLLELRQTVKALNPSCAVLCEMGSTAQSKYACACPSPESQ